MAQILIIDDDSGVLLLLEKIVKGMGHTAVTANNMKDAMAAARMAVYDVILLDLEFPDGSGIEILPDLVGLPNLPEVIIITGTGNVKSAEIAFQYGAWDYVQKPFLLEEVTLPLTRALEYHEEKGRSPRPTVLKRGDITGESPAILRCLDQAAKAAATESSVLIWGETGSGKELFARAIHENSTRAHKDFVVIDCGALSENLVESVLFGHEKGAFTGATDARKGLVSQAHGGTLFLDEIGELGPGIQKTFLRTLQERRVRPVGGGKEFPVDFRLVAATNRDLEQMTEQKAFRSDLLYRIRGIDIKLPPLRERFEDISEIAHHRIKELCKLYGFGTKGISSAFLRLLENHDWPGNVRELMNVLEHSLANAGADPTLVPKHLPPKYRASLLGNNPEQKYEAGSAAAEPLLFPGEEFLKWGDYRSYTEERYLRALILRSEGRWDAACRLSGLSKTRLYELLKKHGLSFA